MDYDKLDAGIREVVRAFRRAGFETTDSGDGTGPGSTPRPWDKLPFGHVAMVVKLDENLREALDRAVRVVEGLGFEAVPRAFEDPGEAECIVELSCNPAEGVAVIVVEHVLDRWIW